MTKEETDVIALRGGGDLATGVAQKFWRAGCRVVILEVARPTAIRRTVALSEAVYDGVTRVEDMTARLVPDAAACGEVWQNGEIPLLVDPALVCLPQLRPAGLVDAILAKRNLGLTATLAPIVVALGPGFAAPADCHAVIETMRGHDLGRVILSGGAKANTGTPGEIGGRGAERVLRSPCAGVIQHAKAIGMVARAGEAVLSVGGVDVPAPFTGLVRGLIRAGLEVAAGAKIADIDPRLDSDWQGISDKARCVGGGVLEAFLFLRRRQDKGRKG